MVLGMADEPGGKNMGIYGALGRAAVLGHVIMDEARIYPGDVRYLGLCVGVGGICGERREEAEGREKKKEKKELRLGSYCYCYCY